MDDWRAAVAASKHVDNLRDVVQRLRHAGLDGRADGIEAYELNNRELWARSWAQWVATRSGDAGLLAEVNAYASATPLLPNGGLATQWEATDFLSVGEAIDRLLRTLGWK